MIVADGKTINSIQKEFNNKFPFLKIEFYQNRPKPEEKKASIIKADHLKKIAEIRSKHNTGDLSINGHLKVSSLEKAFEVKFGLTVQVFRKSGDLWLQTTATDEWTLTEQNEHGKQSVYKLKKEF